MILIYLLLIFGLPLGTLKLLGMRAMRTVDVVIGGLTLEQIVDLGTKSSHSLARRMLGRPKAQPTADGGAEWDIRSNAGVMTVRVEPVPALQGTAFRVSAWAYSVRPANVRTLSWSENERGDVHMTDYQLAKGVTYLLFRLLNIPKNPRKLLRQRRRVLAKLKRAGQVIPALVPQQAPQPLPQPPVSSPDPS